MYKNIGDRNFFEHGILIDTERSDTEFPILYCQPYPDEEDRYQFGECIVDITDSWIDKKEVMKFIGMLDADFDPAKFAIACLEYYGAENFGAESYAYDWTRMSQVEINNILKHHLIAADNLDITW